MVETAHFQPADPGVQWQKDPDVVIDVRDASGMWRVITPNVIQLDTGYRMYYTESGRGMEYRISPASIMSAFSADGLSWEREPGVRLAPQEPLASLRVVCPDVMPLPDGGYRMYLEGQPHEGPNSVMSAFSPDGLAWKMEPGIRFGDGQHAYGSPRCVYVLTAAGDVGYRLYFHQSNFSEAEQWTDIMSAVSADGLSFEEESGVRIAQETELESGTVYAPEVLRLGDGTYRMYYAGWTKDPVRGRILSATSHDGLTWTKDKEPCVVFGGRWDGIKCSEPCVTGLPDGRYRMFYEASDEAGVWRILSATTPE